MLHVTSGDAAAALLRQAGIPGDVLAWRDSPATGPWPGDASPAELRRVRAEYRGVDVEGLQDLPALDVARGQDEIVLWFDACPFDQALLLRLVAHLTDAPARSGALSIVEIGAFPGVPRYAGLGQLTPTQLASRFTGRVVVDEARSDVARRAWAAFGAPDPRALRALLDDDAARPGGAWPHLRSAVRRILQELPSVYAGLSRTESNILGALEGPTAFLALTGEVASREESNHGLWFGDVVLWAVVRALAACRSPLVELEGDTGPGAPSLGAIVRITDDGARAVQGAFDHVVENGADRWVGGTHLVGRRTWRFDARGARLVAPTA